MLSLRILETDTLFTDSPDTGDQTCLCSRCGYPIEENEAPVRAWPKNKDTGQIEGEYRFHLKCLSVANPKIKCLRCEKEVECITLDNGQTYFPMQWTKVADGKFLCPDCKLIMNG